MIVKTIWIMLMALSGCHLYQLAQMPQTPQLSQNCSRNRYKNYFNLICRDSSQRDINIFENDHTLYITHSEGQAEIDLKTFPELQVSVELRSRKRKVSSIKMENCTLPTGLSFGALFKHFGIEDKIIAFEGVNIARSFLDGRFASGFENLEKLTLSKNSIGPLNEIVLGSMTKLTELDLSKNKISAVHQNVFKNLTELRTVILISNEIKALHEGMFVNQKKLIFLCLHDNRLQKLSSEMFRGLDRVEVLTLRQNDLTRLTDDVFNNLPSLQQISLGNSNIRVPYNLFNRQTALKRVFLEKVKLHEGLRLSGLDNLLIKRCEVISISGLSNIEEISIIGSEINQLPATSFNNLSSTKDLNLSFNKMGSLKDGLFDGLKELKFLRLSKNLLTEISGQIFGDLQKVIEMDLSNNNIATIHPDAFANTKELAILDLSNNRLSFSDSKVPFVDLVSLKFLNLSHNHLTTMLSDLWTLERLTKVDLTFNRISSVKFSEIRQNVIHLNSTYETRPTWGDKEISVHLNANKLQCDCSMFDFLTGTDDQRQLAPVFSHECLKDTYGLSVCYRKPYSNGKCPAGCNCSAIEDSSGLHLLISCQGRQLTRWPEFDFNATTIQWDISNNSLTELPTLHANLIVTFIQASYNEISNIELRNLPPNLRGLDLSHNNIQTIAANVIHHLKYHQSLEIFLLKNNPLACHCSSDDTQKMIEFASENGSITDLQEAMCGGYYALTLQALDDKCRREVFMFVLIFVTVLTLVSGVVLILIIRHHKFIKMWLYAHDWFLCWVDEEYVDRDMKYDAFISYEKRNRTLALRVTKRLETDGIFRLCLHERDFLVGERIEKSVQDAVNQSRRILVILSDYYVKSQWCEHEFHLAWERCVAEKRKLLIAIKEGDLNVDDIKDTIIQSYVKTHTYIESDDEWFWERVVFLMPHKKVNKNILFGYHKSEEQKDDVNDEEV